MRRTTKKADTETQHSAVALLEHHLRDKGMRRTPERFAILERVESFQRLFSADDIIASMSDDIFHVSDATVYNTLQLFTRAGILRRHSIGSKPALYENLTAPRAGAGVQLVCTECGAVKTARDPEVDRLLASRRYPSFSRSYYTLHVYGLCSRCARRKNRSATPKNQ